MRSVLNNATIVSKHAELKSSLKSFNKENKKTYFCSCSALSAQGVVKTWCHSTLGTLTNFAMALPKGAHAAQLKRRYTYSSLPEG